MGVDIYMHIVKNKEYIKKDIFDGRNSEWFGSLQGDGWDCVYDCLPKQCGLGDQVPADLDEQELTMNCYYGFYHINVKDFNEWFVQYRPDLDAGWVNTYEKWLYEIKGIVPEVNHYLYLEDGERIEDKHFIEVVNPYDCSFWLYKYIVENNIDNDADIIYYFDC